MCHRHRCPWFSREHISRQDGANPLVQAKAPGQGRRRSAGAHAVCAASRCHRIPGTRSRRPHILLPVSAWCVFPKSITPPPSAFCLSLHRKPHNSPAGMHCGEPQESRGRWGADRGGYLTGGCHVPPSHACSKPFRHAVTALVHDALQVARTLSLLVPPLPHYDMGPGSLSNPRPREAGHPVLGAAPAGGPGARPPSTGSPA